MSASIFVMDDQNRLIPMRPSPYVVEEVLQRLISDFPQLLPLGGETGLRWLLIGREAGIPDDTGVDRFSLDDLLLDSEGIPTLVEVKRSTDTRIRREVVGQLLDYAAYFVSHWTVERIQSSYELLCREEGRDPEVQLQGFLGGERTEDEFWSTVKTNLQAKRIRLLFVADSIPLELRRVVEFLNSVTDPVEVLAVEVPQYEGHGFRTFVPNVIGQTVSNAASKSPGSARPRGIWDRESFLQKLTNEQGDRAGYVAERLIEWAEARRLRIWYGKGAHLASFFPMFDNDQKHYTFGVWSNGTIEMQFQYMTDDRASGNSVRRMELMRRLNNILGPVIPENAVVRRPTFLITLLDTSDNLALFTGTMDWYLDEIVEAGLSARPGE